MNASRSEANCGRTPYDDQYATCERTLATLCIYGPDLEPSEISGHLGIIPSRTQKMGEVFTNSFGRQRTAKLGGWFLTSEGSVFSKDLRRHLDWLLNLLRPKKEALLSVQARSGVWMNVECVWWSKYGEGGPTLSHEQLQGLASLNLECGFEIAFFGDEEEQEE